MVSDCRLNLFDVEGKPKIKVNGLNTQISGFACYLPPNLKTSEETIPFGTLPRGIDFKRLTRIESHHEVLEGQGSLELAVEAANKAIARSGVPKEEIDLVISCSVTKLNSKLQNLIEPCLASNISTALGINAQNFDVANACSGMVTGLMIADRKIKAGKIRNALVVSGEYLTGALYEALDKNLLFNPKALASLTIGDAGGAYVISRSEEDRIRFFEPITLAQHSQLCIGDAAIGRPGPAMRTESKKLQQGALENLGEYLKRDMDGPEEWSTHDHVISHQTTPRAVEKGAMVIEKALGHSDVVRSISDTGNTASTSHVTVLEKLLDNGELKSNQKIYFIAFGSGLSLIGMNFYIPPGVEKW
tara:strand:- start:1800 stop:2879 length:1080 start_codon:yes stop_codon:yes gene_type:complete